MSVNATWKDTNRLELSSAVFTAGRMATGWAYSTGSQLGAFLVSCASTSSGDNYHAVGPRIGSTNYPYIRSRTTSNNTATSSTEYPLNEWYCIGGFLGSATNRRIYLAGSLVGTNATSTEPVGLAASVLGHLPGGFSYGTTHSYAELAVWDVAGFSDAQALALASRAATLVGDNVVDPRTINEDVGEPWTGKLLHYWSLVDNTTEGRNDKVGSANWTIVGTVDTNAAHPTVDVWSEARFVPVVEPLYYLGTPLASKTSLKYQITAGQDTLSGSVLGSGVNGTTDASGNFVLPEGVTLNDDGVLPTANDPAFLHLYWEEGNPAVDRSLIVKTTLVAA